MQKNAKGKTRKAFDRAQGADLRAESQSRLSRSNFEVRKRPFFVRFAGMDFDGKAPRRRGGEAQRCRLVRCNGAFDVITVQVNVHRLVGSQPDDDTVVLKNRQNGSLGRRLCVYR